MRTALVPLLTAALLAGCTGAPKPNPNAPPPGGGTTQEEVSAADLSKVDRVVVTLHRALRTYYGEDAARLAKALADSPVTSAAGAVCREELELQLYTAATKLVATAAVGVGDHPIIVDGETGVRDPSAEAKALFTSIKAELADPYMAQFIPYCDAWKAAQGVEPGAPWRLIFMTGDERTVPEQPPLWVAVAIGTDGSRRKALINPMPTQEPRLAKVLELAPELPALPLKEGKPPLTVAEMLELACLSSDCTSAEAVDVEFRPAIEWPMSRLDETFPAWAVTFADKIDHRRYQTNLYEVYTGGLVTQEGPPK